MSVRVNSSAALCQVSQLGIYRPDAIEVWRTKVGRIQMKEVQAERVPMQVSQGCLVASVQVDLTEVNIRQLRSDLLTRIQIAKPRGVILDLSAIAVMDIVDWNNLRRTLDMVNIMGSKPIICGLRPGVVAALSDMDAEVSDVEAVFDLDSAFELLDRELDDIDPDDPEQILEDDE
jgi:rsbT antagonist protein RsbS